MRRDDRHSTSLVDRARLGTYLIGVRKSNAMGNSEGPVVDSKGFILLCESVTDDIASEGPAVGFPALETAGLEFPAWEPDKLFKFVTDQGGEIDI